MLRTTLSILSLLGLLLSLGLWGVSYYNIVRCGEYTVLALERGSIYSGYSPLGYGTHGVFTRAGKVKYLSGCAQVELLQPARGRLKGQEVYLLDNHWLVLGFLDFETIWRPKMSESPRWSPLPKGARAFRIQTTLHRIFPLWIPAMAFAVLPGYSFACLHRRRRRRKLGLCVGCGYDLRGSNDRCPECGL